MPATITPLLAANGASRNVLSDPLLQTTSLSTNGGTFTDTRPTTGGPISTDPSYYRRSVTVANSSSPMAATLAATGVNGIKVLPGQKWTHSFYARKSAGTVTARINLTWYTPAGSSISTNTGTSNTVTTSWNRFSQTFTAPATAGYVSVVIQWVGTATVSSTLDLGAVQFERADSATAFTAARLIEPHMVLSYGYETTSRNVLIEPLGSGFPTVFLRESQSRQGVLSLLFLRAADSLGAEQRFRRTDKFYFADTDSGEYFTFIVSGPVRRTNTPGTDTWTVDVTYREVAA